MTVACRAYGLRAIDGPFGDFSDPDSYILAAKRGAALGLEGKWAIHPSQIAVANEVFSPPEAELKRAKGQGAAQLDGKMIDAASARMAENVVNVANIIAAQGR